MSAIALMGFLIGSGLMLLGAFFLWRLTQHMAPVLPAVAPVGLLIVFAMIQGFAETAVGVLWGTVIFNLGMVGILGLCFQVRQKRVDGLMMLMWLAFGWVACLIAGNGTGLGRFGGCGLLLVGLVALWQNYQPHERKINHWRWWISFVLAIAICVLGTWLMVRCHTVVATVMGLPVGLFGLLVIAPICALSVCCGLRVHKQWQTEGVLNGLTQTNLLLVTVGLGLMALYTGNLHFTQSIMAVTLPWVAVIAVLVTVSNFLPQKTARWWGGLVALMVLGAALSLFG